MTKTMLLLTVILMDLLAGVEVDLFVPSFPELQTQFNLTPFWVEALLSINFVGNCLSVFFVGGLADRYGRKPIILLGLLIFIVGSIMCLSTYSYFLLLAGRLLQGIGIAAPAILSFLIIADYYPVKKQQFLLAMLNGIMNASVAAAPVVGSYVTLYFHWQGNFMVLLILGILTMVMTQLFIPTFKLPIQKETISLRGYMPIISSTPIMLLIIHLSIIFAPYWIFVGMSPLLYMEDLGVSLSYFGFYQGALALVFALGSVIFGLIMHRYDQKKMLYLANYMLVASLFGIGALIFTDCHNPLLITLGIIPYSLSVIIPCTILYPLGLNYMPHAKGRISALIQVTKQILVATSLLITGYFYHGSFQNIGIVISLFIISGVISLVFVNRNKELMQVHKEK